MTLENLLSQVGIGTKQLTDRYSGEYGAPPVQDQQIYYAYEPPLSSHGHTASSKHHHHSSSSGLKTNASMSALTLLAFLFFLHILQQCIKEHMADMGAAPVVVMSASRESNDALSEAASKTDKTGVTQYDDEHKNSFTKTEKYNTNPYKNMKPIENKMMRINAAQYEPSVEGKINGYVHKNERDRRSVPVL